MRRDISLIAVDGTQSSSFSSLIFLIATVSPVSVFIALYTTPYVPSPNFSYFWYLSKPYMALWLTPEPTTPFNIAAPTFPSELFHTV